jgi:hypothetical protein
MADVVKGSLVLMKINNETLELYVVGLGRSLNNASLHFE